MPEIDIFDDAWKITVTAGKDLTITTSSGGKINLAGPQAFTYETTWVVDGGALSGEEHCLDIAYTGALSSGDSIVGLNIAVTPTGTAGVWAAGIYAKVVQGATKAVNGYLTAAELEMVNSADNVSDNFVLTLNSNNSGAQRGQHESYIALRSYGSLPANSFLWIEDQTIGADNDTTSLLAANNPTAATHTLRIIIDDTAYYIMLCNAASLAS